MSTIRLRLVTGILITLMYPNAGLCDGITINPDGTITILQTVTTTRDEGKVTERDAASGTGTGVAATGTEAVQTKHETTDPNAQLPDRTGRRGGGASGGSSNSEITAKGGITLNPFTLLGGLAIMAGVGCLLLAPQFKTLGISVIGIGAAGLAVGYLVANPLVAAGVMGLGAAGALLYFARKYGLLADTSERLVKAIATAPDPVKADIKTEIGKNTKEINDAVIDELKRRAGV